MRYSCSLVRRVGILLGIGAAILLGANVHPASAQSNESPKEAASGPAKSDGHWTVRTKSNNRGSKRYFIEFRARSAASYGHMYVLYGKVNSRHEVVESRIAGLHPSGDSANCYNCSLFNWTVGHVLFVPSETGASDGDLEEKYVTARYRVWLDAAHYKEIDAYIRKLQADSPMWNALWNNCVGFGRNIAEHMGLKVPEFIWLEPKDFVTDLRTLNGLEKEQLPLKDASNSLRSSAPRTVSHKPAQKPKPQAAAGSPHEQTVAAGTAR